MAHVELRIDAEFSGLCPALSPEERDYLETSLIEEGCREPIVVWANHDDTILDGHNRYVICEDRAIAYTTKALRFDSRQEVVNWIIANQLGRRNLTEEQKSFLIGKRQIVEKLPEGPPQRADARVAPLRTAERLAKQYGVSPRTIMNDAAFAKAVDKIEEAQGPAAKALVLSGKSGLGKAAVVKAAKLPPQEMAKAIATGKLPAEPAKPAPQTVEERMEAANSELEGLARKITMLIKEAETVENPHLSSDKHGRLETLRAQLRSAAGTVRAAKGAGKCRYCGGVGCVRCLKTGWLTRTALESAPEKAV